MHVQSCCECQLRSRPVTTDRVPITPVTRADVPFQVMNLNCIGPLDLPSAQGHKYCLCVVDSCTRWPSVYMLKSLTLLLPQIFFHAPDTTGVNVDPSLFSKYINFILHVSYYSTCNSCRNSCSNCCCSNDCCNCCNSFFAVTVSLLCCKICG